MYLKLNVIIQTSLFLNIYPRQKISRFDFFPQRAALLPSRNINSQNQIFLERGGSGGGHLNFKLKTVLYE